MMVKFHIGGNPTPHTHERSQPRMILYVAKDFPKIIAAHLGGLHMWTQVAQLRAGKENVYMETSMTYKKILLKCTENIIRTHGHHKIFFGTDYPFAPIKKCIESALGILFLNEREGRGYGTLCTSLLSTRTVIGLPFYLLTRLGLFAIEVFLRKSILTNTNAL